MKKFAALMLSIMLVFSCMASAEIATINVNASYMGQEIVNAVINGGYDEDGCSVVSVIADVMGEMVSALIQAKDTEITIASGDEAYTITAEALEQAVQMVSEAMAAQNPASAVSSAISEEDMEIIMTIAMNEVNRIAMIAMNLGVVTISENGDLTIYADNYALVALAAEYLAELSADSNIFAAVASTGIWNTLQLGDAAQYQQMAAQLADQLAAVNPEELGMDVRMYLNVSAADGSMGLELAYSDDWDSFSVKLGASSAAANIAVDYVDSYYGLTSFSATVAPDYVSYYYSQRDDEVSYVYNVEGTVVNVYESIKDAYSSTTVKVAFDTATYVLTGNITVDELSIDMSGELQMFDNCAQYVITLTDGNETHTVSAGINIYATAYSVYATVDNDYYMVTLDIANYAVIVSTNEGIIAEAGLQMLDESTYCVYVTDGEMTYAVAIDAANMTATVSVNGQDIAQVGIQMLDENTCCAYLSDGEAVYSATVAVAETAEGGSIAVSVDAAAGENYMNIATAAINAAMSAESFAHTTGYVMSADEIAYIMASIIESFQY